MEFILNHWEKIVGLISVVFSFFAGLKMRRIQRKEVKYKADFQKLENYNRAFEINSEMIEGVKTDFTARIASKRVYHAIRINEL